MASALEAAMRIVRIFCAIALLASSTAAWPQPAYCDKALCKAWTGPGWYVVYGDYLSEKMLRAGPIPDQADCKAEAAKLAKKSPQMEGEFFCLLLESGEKAAKDYMKPI